MTSLADQLLELQRIDTVADQLAVQRERSPLRTASLGATEALRTWEQQRARIGGRIEALNDEIARDEERGAELATHLARLERQLKTVIAPREAEALMHEIAALTAERDDLDLRELEAMEEQAPLETELATHLQDEPALRAEAKSAGDALASATADIDQQLGGLQVERMAILEVIPRDLVVRYERGRPQLGVVVSRLNGKQCTGCHLDLSAAEIDTARAGAAADGYTDCPQCGRILVV